MKRSFILFHILLIPSLLLSQVLIEKIFETESVLDYNKWIQESTEEFPDISPIYFQIERIKTGKTTQNAPLTFNPPPDHPSVSNFVIHYCNDKGEITKNETITGYIKIRDLGNEFILIIRLNNPSFEFASQWVCTIKDKNGDVVFEVDNNEWVSYFDEDRFIVTPMEDPILSTARIVGKDKREIASLSNIARFSKILKTPRDDYILYSGENMTIITKELKKGWHYSPEIGAIRIAYNSSDYIAIGEEGRISIYTPEGDLKKVYNIAKTIESPSVCFVNDGKYLFASLMDRICYYDNRTFKRVWSRDISLAVDKLIYSAENGNFIFYISVRMAYAIDLEDGEIKDEIEFPIKKRHAFLKSETGDSLGAMIPVAPIDYSVQNSILVVKQGGLFKDRFKIMLFKLNDL